MNDFGEPWYTGQDEQHRTKIYAQSKRLTTPSGSALDEVATMNSGHPHYIHERIVACVNACVGIPTERLNIEAKTLPNNMKRIIELEKDLAEKQESIKHLKEIILASLPALRMADKACSDLIAYKDTADRFVVQSPPEEDSSVHAQHERYHKGEIKNHLVYHEATKAISPC